MVLGSSSGSSLKGSVDGALPFSVSNSRGDGGHAIAGASIVRKQRPDEQLHDEPLPDENPLKLQLPEGQQLDSQLLGSQQPESQQLDAAQLLSQLAGQHPSLMLMQPDAEKTNDANISAQAT